MSTDLTTRGVVVPVTGEALSLDAPAQDLARALDEIRDVEQQLRAVKGVIADEIHARMDRERCWTLRDGSYEMRGESDEPKVDWDAQRLIDVLRELVAENVITAEAAEAAVALEPKVRQRGLQALRKNPALRERIDECGTEAVRRQRRVSVKRAA